MSQTVLLGGELQGRNILGTARNRLEWVGFVAMAGGGLVYGALNPSIAGLIVVGFLIVVATVLFTPSAVAGGGSVAGQIVLRVRYGVQKRTGAVSHLNALEAVEAGRAPDTAPSSLGRVRPFEIDLTAGPGGEGERLLVLRQSTETGPLFTTVFEMRGTTAGLVDDDAWGRNHEGWSRFKASLASNRSLIRTLQQVSRVVPYDATDHVAFMVDRMPAETSEILLRSYGELLDGMSWGMEQHRSYLVIGMPQTARWRLAAGAVDLGTDADGRTIVDGQRADEVVIREQLRSAMSWARACGFDLRPLDRHRASAVLRSLQDPGWALDDLTDADWATAFPTWDGARSPEHLVVSGRDGTEWYTRTALVPRDGIEAAPIPVDFLRPLLTDVNPSVVRTISSIVDLVPAAEARRQARHDQTSDRASHKEAQERVSDGSAEAQMTASRQRLVDLAPGSGAQGANWSLAVTIQARSEAELRDATFRIEEAADNSAIKELRWQDHAQHLHVTTTLPLCRNVDRRKPA